MTRVLVTGALGFTGRHLAHRLASGGTEVHGLVRPDEAKRAVPDFTALHPADLGDPASLARALAEVRPDRVVHLAGVAFVAHDNAAEIYEANLLGSRNLLQALVDSGSHPSAVVLASSANIYGNRREGLLDESITPEPVSDYAVSKLAMEHVAHLFADRLPVIVARPFNYTGVGQSPDFVIPKIVDHARRRAKTIELGNLDVERDFSDVRGVADVYARLTDCPEAIGGTFNICSGRGYSLRQVIDMVETLSGHTLQVEVNAAFVRPNEVRTLYGDNSRLTAAIGPLNMPPLQDTLRWMLEAAAP